jgi:outer membrane lipoprotein-sorting protein
MPRVPCSPPWLRAPRSALVAMLLGAALVGCRTTGTPPPAEAALPSPAEVLAMVSAGNEARRSLQAVGRVTYFGAQGRVRGKAVIVAQRPGSFRVETLSPLEQPIEVVTSDGRQLWLLSQDTLRSGEATPENLARVLPLPMRPDEVVDTLLGGVPTSADLEPLDVAVGDEGRWVLSLRARGGELCELTIDPVRRLVERLRLLHRTGALRVEVQFDDFEPLGQLGQLPRSIVARLPADDLDLRLKLTEVEANAGLPPELFRIEAPPGTTPLPLDAPAPSAPGP